ncbi:DUF2249 domain-containing protein [Halobaculum sp. D14]|uniref:DUF2249 domain-containing protein n=1 Tax=unclassified Halobaculum TaxID=2640896 RepID=UPI003EB82173
MVDVSEAVDASDAPPGQTRETLDVRELPPPQPLQRTLERCAELDEDAALVQLNDRAPQHLYPRLSDRGFEYDTVEAADAVVTVIWRG